MDADERLMIVRQMLEDVVRETKKLTQVIEMLQKELEQIGKPPPQNGKHTN